MLVFFENYPYDKGILEKYLEGTIPIVPEEGKSKVLYIGYLFVSRSGYTGPVFLLPKLFLQKETNRADARYSLLGFNGFYPELIYKLDSDMNPLLGNDMETFLPELSLWLYRAMTRYLEEISKEPDEDAYKELYYVTPADGTRDRDFLSTVIRLMDFLADHRNLFTQISIINHSGNAAIDWHKTVAQDPFFLNGKPYYLELKVKDKTINIDEELIIIYYSVLNYLRVKFKFPIQLGDIPYDLLSVWEIQHYLDSGLGERRLRDIRGKYFRDDLKYLWKLLDSFFNFNLTSDDKNPRREALVVSSFERVFERMVDQLIGSPKELDALKKQKDGKLIDHIYRDKSLIGGDNEIYFIGDSKYYRDEGEIKGVSFYKQFTYAKNAIQYNIERINLKGKETLDKLRYRDELTEGYNVTPNFFIRPKIETKELKYDQPSLKWSGENFAPNKQFQDRLFDRDTLLLREYNINLLFIIAAYGSYEDWKAPLRDAIREDMIKFLNKKYIFFEIVPAPYPIYSGNKKVFEIPFIENYNSLLRGKMYRTSDDSESLVLAFESDTKAGKEDLAKARETIGDCIAGGSLTKDIARKP